MTLLLPRRRFLGLVALFAAPAIVRIENIMPVRAYVLQTPTAWRHRNGRPVMTINSVPLFHPSGRELEAGDLVPGKVYTFSLSSGLVTDL